LAKGKLVYIEGRLHTRSWEKDGITRYTTEVLASDMRTFATKEPDEKEAAGNHASNNHPASPPFESYPMDDDIPF
jgi:single-strand DNA-binding protein